MSPHLVDPGTDAIQDCLSEGDFAIVQDIARKEAGLLLPESKRFMVQSRLSRRVRATGAANLPEYIQRVRKSVDRSELNALVSVLTTNVTSFFREAHHFQTLAENVLPSLLTRARDGGRVRLWSAGCSSGEEAYSLAMLLTHMAPNAAELDIRILATDVDQAVLATARKGIFRRDGIANAPRHLAGDIDLEPAGADLVSMPDRLRRLISFKHLNLHEKWPMTGAFDVIMCRNVVIYFDAEHQAALWPRFYCSLVPAGWLFLGHSERIHPLEGSGFVAQGLTTYQKQPKSPAQSTEGA